jgi:putative serine protease PepD
VDDPFANQERQHRTWRDLPPTPPIETPPPEPVFAAQDATPPAAAPGQPRVSRQRTVGTFALGVLAGVLVLGVAGAGLVSATLGSAFDPLAAVGRMAPGGSIAPGGSDPSEPPGTTDDEPLADTAAKLLPSVVQIEAGAAIGSGFIADVDGWVLTASHVVGREDRVTLKLDDGTAVEATVVARDRTIDTAVLRADDKSLPPATLGRSADVRVGQVAIAVGSPFGYSQTVTTGIVSALGRTLETPIGELRDLIQTDAAINSGNSGGPLADREGKIIGINTAIASTSGGSDGVGFAVPIDTAVEMLRRVQAGDWTAEDDIPADVGTPSLPFGPGGLDDLFDQLFGPGGLDELFGGDLFGTDPFAEPSDPTDPTDPGAGTDPFAPLFGDLFGDLFGGGAFGPEAQPSPDAKDTVPPGDGGSAPAPAPTPTPAPDQGFDADPFMRRALDALLDGLLDEMFGAAVPGIDGGAA